MNVQQIIQRRQYNSPMYNYRDYHVVPRDPYLRSIEGTHKVSIPPILNRHSILAQYLYLYFGYASRVYDGYPSIGQLINRNMQLVDNTEIPKEILEVLKTGMVGRLSVGKFFRKIYKKEFIFDLYTEPARDLEITISCRYKDILKCSISRNYSSCFKFNGMYCNVPLQYLQNPGVAIAFVRDKSGKFSSRIFLYLGKNHQILLGRPYGIIEDIKIWADILEAINPVYVNPDYCWNGIRYIYRRMLQKFYLKYKLESSYSDILTNTALDGEQYIYV